MSNLVNHAEKEFDVLGWPGDCEMQRMICGNVLELLTAFSGQGHSGSSAPYVIGLFSKLASFEPISPLIGDDSEWNEITPEEYQNNRDGEVFKDSNGAYWAFGKIFRDSDGCTYTSKDSLVPIAFPWTRPEPMIVDVKDE